MPFGFLLIDKPAGMTSHDVVARIRRLTGEKTVGHAGTLDPFATGLLVVGVGREATKEFQKLVGLDKEYEAVFTFGATSDTNDRTGKIVKYGTWNVERPDIEQALPYFIGNIKQIPPAYAAIKIGGKKMYEAAREGKPLVAEARDVRVDAFEMLDSSETPPNPLPSASLRTGFVRGGMASPPTTHFPFRIACGSGTYIRALARDLGTVLGTGAYVEELRRTKVGPFSIDQAVPLQTLPTLRPLPLISPATLLSALSTKPSSATVQA